MNAPAIQAPEAEAHDVAVAELWAAEHTLADALVWAQAAQWAEPMRASIAQVRLQLRAILQDLA